MDDAGLMKQLPDVEIDCSECNHLRQVFGEAVHVVLMLHEQQFLAVVEDESNPQRFDLLIHHANERKQTAKYAYMQHRERLHKRPNELNETDRN